MEALNNTQKTCLKCQKQKSIEDFGKHKASKDGHCSECKQCANARSAKHRAEHPEKVKASNAKWRTENPDKLRNQARKWCNRNPERAKLSRRKSHLRRKYGLSIAEYDAMSERQQNKCAICKEETKLVVDHCHATGKVRGLLCDECNRAIGLLKDSADNFKSAISYLEVSNE